MEKIFASGVTNGKAVRNTNIFKTLPCADLQWNELVSTISKLNDSDIADEDIDLMSYHKRYDTLNKNPLLGAFLVQVGSIFQRYCTCGPLGKTQHYAI